MPLFVVRLAAPAWYQPDHPLARREVTELDVFAATKEGAEIHAYRVLTGEVKIVGTDLVQDKRSRRPAPVEDAPLPTPEGIGTVSA